MELPVIFFDGVCNLCNSTVTFIINHDSGNIFKFAPLQSEPAKKILGELKLRSEDFRAVILLSDCQIFSGSDAIIKIFQLLGFPWSLFAFMKIFPRKIRDAIYGLVASHRYGWFGKRESCMIPDAKIKSRFL